MKFALVIFETETSRLYLSEDRASFRTHYETWISELSADGRLVGGDALDVESSANPPVTIRTEVFGATTPTMGPAHTAAETLGGWFVIDAADQAEAIALASRLGTHETIEIHPVLEAARS